jgi:hypothetical protein
MALMEKPLTPLDDRKVDLINAALASADSKLDWHISAIAEARGKAEAAGDDDGVQALLFAGRVLFTHVKGLDPKMPDTILAERAGEPDEGEFEAMKTLAQRVTLASARARIADLVWQKARDHTMAEIAVKAYLEAGMPHEGPEEWPSCTNRYSRALKVAAEAGKGRPLFAETLKYLEEAIGRHGPNDSSFLTCQLMEMVFDHKRREPEVCARYSAMLGGIAGRFEQAGNHYGARECWGLKEKWENAARNPDGARAARAELAESFVKEADRELASETPNHTHASFLIRHAVGILDKSQPDARPRIAELRQRLEQLAEKTRGEMKGTRHSIDVTDFVSAARERVSGKSLVDAMVGLAVVTGLPPKAALEKSVRGSMKGFLQYLFPAVMIGPGGTRVAVRPGVSPSSDPDDSPVLAEMVKECQLYVGMSVVGSIEPARETVLFEHDLREHHFVQLAWASSFVPEGREEVFSRGLFAGMSGDFLTAGHLLVPQIENSIRVILKQSGVNTVLINRTGLDEERDLGWLLQQPKTKELFGEDTPFVLRALLLHRFGPHIRDLLAHGTLEPVVLSAPPGIYLWWLALRLCYAPLLARQVAERSAAAEAEPGASEVQ